MFQDDYNEYSEDKSGNHSADEDNPIVELIPYESDIEEDGQKEEEEEVGGMEHAISTPQQHKPTDMDRNNVKISVTSATLENDVHVNHETLLDTIKCEFVSIT